MQRFFLIAGGMVIFAVSVAACGMFSNAASDSAGALTKVQIEKSTDGGDNWAQVFAQSGSATGITFISADDSNNYWLGICVTPLVWYRVHHDDIPDTDEKTLEDALGTGTHKTMKWNNRGQYAGIN